MIAYTFNQVKYILYHYYQLSRGKFPDPEVSERLSISTPGQGRAGYEAACLMASEVGLRVRKCGLDGMIVEAVFMGQQGLRKESEVAKEHHLDEADVHRRIRRVVAYCEGFDTREEEYEEWRKENRFKRGMR
jgi:hypothetical protein